MTIVLNKLNKLLTFALFFAALALSANLPATALAADAADGTKDASGLSLELNKLEKAGENCRVYLLMGNKTDAAFSDLKLDLVTFDAQGVIGTRLLLQAAPLAAGKTRLKVFDVQGTACDNLGKVLLNDINSCTHGDKERPDCLSMIATSSRAGAGFIQ